MLRSHIQGVSQDLSLLVCIFNVTLFCKVICFQELNQERRWFRFLIYCFCFNLILQILCLIELLTILGAFDELVKNSVFKGNFNLLLCCSNISEQVTKYSFQHFIFSTKLSGCLKLLQCKPVVDCRMLWREGQAVEEGVFALNYKSYS